MIASLLAPLLPAAALAVNVAAQLARRAEPPRAGHRALDRRRLSRRSRRRRRRRGAPPRRGRRRPCSTARRPRLADLIAYLCLSYCYFNFLNLGITARRIRLLIELLEAPGGLDLGGDPPALRLARRWSDARLGRLLAGGQVRESGGRYTIGAPLLLSARAIVLLKVLFLGTRSEFERPVRDDAARVPWRSATLTTAEQLETGGLINEAQRAIRP